MDIIQLKKDVDRLLETATIDDYLFDKQLTFIRELVVQTMAPNNVEGKDEVLINEFKREFEKAVTNNDEQLANAINEIAKLTVNGYFFKKEETKEVWGEPYEDHRGRGIVRDLEQIGTGKFYIDFSGNRGDLEKVTKQAIGKTPNILPKEWKKLMVKAIECPYDSFIGRYFTNEYSRIYNEFDRTNYYPQITEEDLMVFLATKLSIVKNESIISARNEIVLGMGSGIAAKIQIRERSNIHKSRWAEAIGIYHSNTYRERFEKTTILFQEGYADSELKIAFPKGYYFITQDYCIEISYFPSPILIENSLLFKSIANHSAQAMLDDEEEKRRLDEDFNS